MKKTDRSLLERAAKAAGLEIHVWGTLGEENVALMPSQQRWNPLTDDGDALRLAVKLRIEPRFLSATVQCVFCEDTDIGDWESCLSEEKVGEDINAATRRAIVMAAAKINQAEKATC